MLPGVGRFRVNVFQQRSSRVMALRAVKAQVRLFQELHLPAIFTRIAEAPSGIVLVTGATGSGKSTTLAAMVEHINVTARKHIITLEDPIEYLFEDKQSVIEQREVGLDTSTFGSGLKNVLRQDPDVIVIGEMRDSASVAAAISAANIGHLVIATLHTVDAAKSVQRILEFFPGTDREPARQQLANTLQAVICQRLTSTHQLGEDPAHGGDHAQQRRRHEIDSRRPARGRLHGRQSSSAPATGCKPSTRRFTTWCRKRRSRRTRPSPIHPRPRR